MKDNETWGSKELVNFLTQRAEALRIENLKLQSELDKLTMAIEVCDAQNVANEMGNYYNFMEQFNYTLKNN